MKKTQLILIFSLLAASIFMAGCGTLVNPSSWPGVSVEGETVYVAYGNHVYALQLTNGTERWRFPEEAAKGKSFYSTPVFDGDGNVYFGSYSQNATNGNDIYKVEQQNGNELWQFDQANNRYIASPLVVEGEIYAPNADSAIYKLTAEGDWLEDWVFNGEEPLWAQPEWEDGRLYVSGMDHHVYALDAESGEVIWISDDVQSAIASPPLVGEGDVLYVGTFGSEILAIDKAYGEIQWRAEMDDWVWATPALMDGNLYVGDQSGTFLVLDAETGDELWRLEADGGILGTALVLDGKVYFGTETGKIYRVDSGGDTGWDFAIIHTVAGKVYGPLAAGGDRILVGVVGGDAILVAIDLDGSEKWDFSPEN
jgi:outer membrane protein assembly factor BamB